MHFHFTFFIATMLVAQTCFAQLFGNPHYISTASPFPGEIFAADLDGDGDNDLLVASGGNNTVAWYENLGGGNFGNQQIIFNLAAVVESVYAADLDSDGDMDVLSASPGHDKIAWYENLGGGSFGSEQIITTQVDYIQSVYAADLDNDGDPDVLSAAYSGSEIAWFENLGLGIFGMKQVISNETIGPRSVQAADLDNDGNIDVLSSSYLDDKIAWYKNLGGGLFGTQQIISTFADGPERAFAVDLDGDGDMDVLSASSLDNKIAKFENLGGGNFGFQQIISTQPDGVKSVFAADLDGDGDADVLSASTDDDTIAWYENLGNGSFGVQQVIYNNANGTQNIYAADMDEDGDIDVISSWFFYQTISWFENLTGEGCTDPGACNFDSDATLENGSCCYSNCGCMDPIATNYLPSAICDNGSCTYTVGCTDALATNFNPEAVIDDGSCTYIEGCTNELASNFNPQAAIENGTCVFRITGTVFFDENENAVKDVNEYGLPFRTVVMPETGQTYITNDDGKFIAIMSQAQIATFELFNTVTFPFNTTPNPQVFNANTSLTTNFMFGVSNEIPMYGIAIDFYPDGLSFLCNDYTNFNICFRNMSNIPIDGIIKLEYDPLFQGYQEVTPIDSVIGNTIYMSYENLLPGQMFFYNIELLTPTVNHIGESVTNIAKVYGYYEGNQVAYGEKVRTTEITCAYDPNDKQAFPLGYTDEHLLLQETQQEFVIRFQNTGNSTAQNIRVQDTLDVNFDIESFRLIANTHSVMTTIDPETRLIDFYFENIQLPDSLSDERASHGLISYMITPLPDLPVGTLLENTAYIYFDNNDPIITNTTWTTIHECGGESAFEATTVLVCDVPQVNFESTYDLVEQYSWQVDGVEVGVNPELLLTSLDNPDYEVTLTASNPLCTETVTLNYEVPDIAMIDPCRADFNCDGNRDTQDLLVFMGEFGCLNECQADLDDNAIVNVGDLFILVSVFDQDCWE